MMYLYYYNLHVVAAYQHVKTSNNNTKRCRVQHHFTQDSQFMEPPDEGISFSTHSDQRKDEIYHFNQTISRQPSSTVSTPTRINIRNNVWKLFSNESRQAVINHNHSLSGKPVPLSNDDHRTTPLRKTNMTVSHHVTLPTESDTPPTAHNTTDPLTAMVHQYIQQQSCPDANISRVLSVSGAHQISPVVPNTRLVTTL